MFKKLLSISACTLALSAPQVWAGADSNCHFHGYKPASEATVSGCANDRKAQLIKQGKLDASWGSAPVGKLEHVEGKKGKEWRVTFANAAEKDKAKQSLYMFYTLQGNFIAANHTGQ